MNIRDNELIYGTEDIDNVIEIHSEISKTYSGHKQYKVNTYYKCYRGIPIDFLEGLFGDKWQDKFESMYSDVAEFKEEYGVELEEWLEFENNTMEK